MSENKLFPIKAPQNSFIKHECIIYLLIFEDKPEILPFHKSLWSYPTNTNIIARYRMQKTTARSLLSKLIE